MRAHTLLAGTSLRSATAAAAAATAAPQRWVPLRRTLHATPALPKSKRSQVTTPAPAAPDEVPVIKTRGKGAKGASSTPKGARSKHGAKGQAMEDAEADDGGEGSSSSTRKTTTTDDASLPNERFDEAALKANMARAVSRCRETVAHMVGSHGRADPSLLDGIRVSFTGTRQADATAGDATSGAKVEGDSQEYSLRDFATVGVRDGALIVTCFDAESVKQVERAIYAAHPQLGLTPQQTNEEGVLRIPVPRPTAETRAQLVKDVNRVCENARVSIRSARHAAQKQIKEDTRTKVVGSSEAQREMKKMEEETKKRAAEVEQLFEQTKKRIEQGQ